MENELITRGVHTAYNNAIEPNVQAYFILCFIFFRKQLQCLLYSNSLSLNVRLNFNKYIFRLQKLLPFGFKFGFEQFNFIDLNILKSMHLTI